MFKKSSIFALSIGVSLLGSTAANAIELDEATRTVALDSSGKTTVLTAEQVKRVSVYLVLHVDLAILVVLQRQTQILV